MGSDRLPPKLLEAMAARHFVARTLVDCIGIAQQAMKFFFDDLVTLAAMSFQTGFIQHRDVPPAVTDQACALQISGGIRDAFAAHAEQAGNQFLRHGQFTAGQTVEGQ